MPPAEGSIVRCAGCGAIQKECAAGSCQYCGAKFALPEPAPAPTPVPVAPVEPRAPSTLDWLRWLESQPDRETRYGQPSARVSARQSEFTLSLRAQMGCGIVLIIGAALFLLPCLLFLSIGEPGMLFVAFVPLAAATLGIFLVRGARSGIREVRSDLQPCFAAIVDKRTHVETRNDRAWTTYYATLELVDGNRTELETSGDLYGGLRSGDVGVAWRNEMGKPRLLDFRVVQPV